MPNKNPALVEIQGISKTFGRKNWFDPYSKAPLWAVREVSFEIKKGQTLGLVGESGCGKSTLGRLLLRLLEPSAGRVLVAGQDLAQLSNSEMRKFRKKMQIIFQDPYASLNPRHTLHQILNEPLEVHQIFPDKKARFQRIKQLLDLVGIPQSSLEKYPHEFSGGQRQRIGIARALSLEPDFIVCDEPVSALDVSIQAQIINLLKKLQEELHLTLLFISHDLRVVEYISDRVAVMYLGQIVEMGEVEQVFNQAKHPYTKALLSSVPQFEKWTGQNKKNSQRIILPGEIPSARSLPPGCAFQSRCPYAQDRCKTEAPIWRGEKAQDGFACFLENL